MVVPLGARQLPAQLGTRTDYLYRTDGRPRLAAARRAMTMPTGEGMIPIAVDAGLNAAYVLKKLNGRCALYRVKLDGSMATELVYANDACRRRRRGLARATARA